MNSTARQYLILHEEPWRARGLAARPHPAGVEFTACSRFATLRDLSRRPGVEAVLACHPFQGLGAGALAVRMKSERLRVPVILCAGAADARKVIDFMRSGASMFLQWAIQPDRHGAESPHSSRADR